MRLETRRSFGWPLRPQVHHAKCENGTVVHYDGANKGLAKKDHDACRAYWKWCRGFHMKERGWSDIGYSFAVCPHGTVMEGRGFGFVQAAQPGGNSTWTSVTFMSGPDEHPTDKQVQAYRELRSWLRSLGMKTGERPHKDFISTSCPGPILAAMVKNGTLRGFSGVPTSSRPGVPAPPFPIPDDHWFGAESRSLKGHSGYWERDRRFIRMIQERLKERGWSVEVTGRWSPALTSTTRKFQAQKNGLNITGIVGRKTWKALWEAKIT